MKRYHYFVSYQYNNLDDHGFGQINLLLKQPIIQAEQIEEVRKYLEETYRYNGVVLLNFMLLREEKVEEEVQPVD